MRTTESECLEALRDAADRLGKSPSKAKYEDLGIQPSSATIIRVVGGWNEAKKRAGLETNTSRGSRVESKPLEIELPIDVDWSDLSVDQRWHYRNREWNAERTLRRRSRLRLWVNEQKSKRGCEQCGVSDPAVLDCHHPDPSTKEMEIGTMVTYGYSKDKLEAELERCYVLCSNCHRKLHYEKPEPNRLRAWVLGRKRNGVGCTRCKESDHRCLVYHHESDKRDTIGNLVSDGVAESTIKAEIERCTLLCSNCHRIEHFVPPVSGNSATNYDTHK